MPGVGEFFHSLTARLPIVTNRDRVAKKMHCVTVALTVVGNFYVRLAKFYRPQKFIELGNNGLWYKISRYPSCVHKLHFQ